MIKLFLMIKEAIFKSDFFSGAFWLATIGAVFYQLRSVPVAIFGVVWKHLVFTINFDENDRLYYYFEKWLEKYHGNKYRIVEASVRFAKHLDIESKSEITDKEWS